MLRLQSGDRIEVIDSAAASFEAAIDDAGAIVRATLLGPSETRAATPAALRCDVAQAVPKGSRMELVIEKGTELGANRFLPFYSERSVARSVGAEKLERWRRLARSAAQQSGRTDVPEIAPALAFDALLERFESYEAVFFAWELAARVPLYRQLLEALPNAGGVLVVVGPEGGFTHEEADAAQRRGATLISLGARILRTDTAAMALLAVIGALAS